MTLPIFRALEYDQRGEGKLRDIYNKIKNKVTDTVNAVSNRVKDVLGGFRLKFSPSIRKLLEKYGNEKIVSIKILREPINSVINTVLNWISNGAFQENIKKQGYDTAFHLYMYIKLESGTTLRWDKNQGVHCKVVNWEAQGANVESTPAGNPGNTLNEFLNNGIRKVGESDYFIYSSGSNNCQAWIRANLMGNGLWNDTLNNFILQDAKKIYENLGLLEKVNKVITDTAHMGDILLNGAGKTKIRKLIKKARKGLEA